MTFVKGKSGNPRGAPKRNWTWSGELQKAVERKKEDGIPIKRAVAESLVSQALLGNVVATKELMNRMDGLPNQSTDITSGGKPIPILSGTINVPGNNSNEEDTGTD